MIKIILADDHNLFRDGMKLLLNSTRKMQVIAEASNGREFLDLLDDGIEADVVLLDIEMPVMNGIEATQKALERYPELKIISLSMYDDEEYYSKMIEAGAKGFILKSSDLKEVIDAINAVMNGNTYFSSDVLYSVVMNLQKTSYKEKQVAQLSDREQEVLSLICKGLSNQEIGDKLYISKRTVEKHRAALLAKTDCKNTANLVMYAIENNLLDK